MSARDRFNGIEADFWDCATDPAVLTHTDPISALEALLESRLNYASPTEDQIRSMRSLGVDAYRREEFTPEMISWATDRALDQARESLDEDSGLGDSERGMFSVDLLAQHRGAFESAVRELAAAATIHSFAHSRTVELTPEEVIEIMLSERPEWFGAEAVGVEAALAHALDTTREAVADQAAGEDAPPDSGPIEWVNDRPPPEAVH